jgi:hypothetical protein
VRLAIESHASLGSYYQGTAQAITEELTRAQVPPARIGAERDRIILAAAMSYLMTAHPVLISEDLGTMPVLRVPNQEMAGCLRSLAAVPGP